MINQRFLGLSLASAALLFGSACADLEVTNPNNPDIDRALPRLVAAVTLVEAFGYSQLELTERELGVGLIIEAGLRKP